MSTISASATRGFSKRLAEKGVSLLDAPVSGGDVGAINATLTIMVGGDKAAFDKCVPLLQTMGAKVTHVGTSGAGQATKMVNQIMSAACLLGVCEGLVLAEKEGLDLEQTIDIILGGNGASTQLKANGPKVAKGDYSPGFMLDLFIKDHNMVNKAQKDHSVGHPITTLALKLSNAARDEFGGREGTQSMAKILEKMQINV